MKTLRDFLHFVRTQGVVGLAVGFILGGSITKLITAFVGDIVNPLLGLVLGTVKGLETFTISIGPANVQVGHFISALIDFAVMAFVVYFGVKVLKFEKLDKKKDE